MARLIADADALLTPGLDESQRQGHLNQARDEFDRAVELYLTAPGGALREPAGRRGLPRTPWRRSSVRELEALAAGDGFRRGALRAGLHRRPVGDLPVGAETPTERGRAGWRGRRWRARRTTSPSSSTTPCWLVHRSLPGARSATGSAGPSPAAAATCRASARSSRPRACRRTSPTSRWWRAPSRPTRSPGPRRGACGSSSPTRAAATACTQDWWVDERSDPEKATRAAARYLRTLYEDLPGLEPGPRRLQRGSRPRAARARAATGPSDFWALSRGRAYLPRRRRTTSP